jgi:ATP/maltotriose-dependent transcriptional regulator MalT
MDDDYGLVLPLATLGWLLLRQGDPAAAVPLLEESIALSRNLDREWELARALIWVGYAKWLQGDLEKTIALVQEGLSLARELGDRTLIARALNAAGYTMWNQGDLDQGTALTQGGLTLARELGDKTLILSTLETLGSILLSKGDLDGAIACFTEGLSVAQELGNETLVAWHLRGLARVAVVRMQLKLAVRLFGAAAVRYDINIELSPDLREDYVRMVENVRAKLGEQAFAAAWAEGRKMTLEQILAAPEPQSTPGLIPTESHLSSVVETRSEPSYDKLTVRELEVLRLVARGWTDAQIAEQLVISRRTVNAHLTSIYSKIHVSSRSAATRYAIDRKLV